MILPLPETEGRRIGYARVSTKDQKLRMQLNLMNKIGCDKIFKDHGVSGRKSSRKALNQMLEYLQEGDIVVVYKLDRLGRSLSHLVKLLEFFKERNIHLYSMCEGINTITPHGRLIYNIVGSVAEFMRESALENTLYGIQAAREAGKTLGRPPKLSESDISHAYNLVMVDGVRREDVAEKLDISRMTLDRNFKAYERGAYD